MVMKDVESEQKRAGKATIYSRNWAFVSPQLQAKLASTRLLFAGTGLGSVIARAAVQTGFQQFILADGDTVEESNLNRQAFTGAQLGQNKAQAIADTILAISPEAKIEAIPNYLAADDFPDLVHGVDLVINTIDLDNPAFLALNREARAQGKVTLFPMNLGWGGCLLVFSQTAMSLDDYLRDGDPAAKPETLVTNLIERVATTLPGGMPDELARLLPRYVSRTPESWPFDPQLGVAAHLTAALTVRAAVALVAGEPVRVAPDVIWVDATSAIAPMANSVEVDAIEGEPSLHEVTSYGEADLTYSGDRLDVPENMAVTGPSVTSDVRTEPIAVIDPAPFQLERLQRRIQRKMSGFKVITRSDTGLSVITTPHGALLDDERAALARYRLEQYVLAGFYRADLTIDVGIREDPSMALLNPDDVHIIVATTDGIIASYLCLQRASSTLRHAMSEAGACAPAEFSLYPVMSKFDRPVFPVETEYGELFARHPGFLETPISTVREITRLVRNLSQDGGIRTRLRQIVDLAIAETLVATERHMVDRSNRIEAIIGCMAPEARQALFNFRIPIAYAPNAIIMGDNLSGGAPEKGLLWTDESHETGRFWPFALSDIDVRAESDHFDRLEAALNCASVQEARRMLAFVRRGAGRVRHSRYAGFVEHLDYAGAHHSIAWTDFDSQALMDS